MTKRTRKADQESSAHPEMEAFLASKAIDHTSDYVQRGRALSALSEEQVTQSWQSLWNELRADPLDQKKRDMESDFASEFKLRGKEPPWDLVRKQVMSFLADSSRARRKWKKKNPDAVSRANEAIDAELRAFLSKRNRSN
jgi:hypothetical protein